MSNLSPQHLLTLDISIIFTAYISSWHTSAAGIHQQLAYISGSHTSEFTKAINEPISFWYFICCGVAAAQQGGETAISDTTR